MTARLTAIFLGLCLLHFPLQARTFTNTKGQTIDAEIIATSGSSVILRTSGREFTIPINTLSADDQSYIREWIAANPGAERLDFSFFVNLKENKRGASQKVDYDERLQVFPQIYQISVTSQNPSVVRDLRIEYQIFVEDFVRMEGNAFRNLAYSGSQRMAKTQRIKGTLEVTAMAPKERIDMDREFTIEKYVDRDFGRVDVAKIDKVRGVWIRVYKGDKMMEEYKKSEDNRLGPVSWEAPEEDEHDYFIE